ncbi:hypothetical protein D9611_006651 [Ephemerocybe angulata]|uniref:Nephrocystin 3-like N-terminal domain-containing protein n=1 Tax=Ephemerocybe angulata TaxID=980116 RepID=A0A8H5FH82_9AGAR|nr:hypothetical protein D9611_006651 [Tulosesus angulatus]
MTEIPGKKKSKVKGGLMKRIKDTFRKGSGSKTPRSESPSLATNAEGFKLGGPSIQSHHEPGAGPAFLDGRSNQESLEVPLNPQLACDEPRGEAKRPLIKDSRDDTEPEGVSSALSPEADISVPSEGIGSKIYGSVKTTLRLVVEMGDVFPPVKSTAAGLLFIFDLIDAYGENHEEFNKLLERVKVLSAILTSCPKNVPEEVLDRFRGLSLTLHEKELLLKQKLENRSKVERVILSTQDKEEVIKLTQEIKMIIEIAVFTSVTQNEVRTIQAVSDIKWLKHHVTIIEQASGGLRNMEKDIEFLRKSELLRKLGEVEGAEYDNQKRGGGCTPGTRISLLATLLIWAMDRDSAHLFWLSGPAGTGKTAVSKTFCAQLAQRGTYGASFLCSVQEKDLHDVYLIIPTVAKILAEERPDFGRALEQVLLNDRSCRSPKTMSLDDQYSKLILEPASKVFTPDDLLVVCIDALDECKDKGAIGKLLHALSRKPNVPLKFFLTSRPEIALRTSLQSSGRQLRLYDIEEHVVKADVMLFLTEQFRAVPAIYEAHKDTWPPPEIEAIADFSGKLFIVAFTAFKYITAPNGVCLERFKHFVQRSPDLGSSPVNTLYDGIMTEAFQDLHRDEQGLLRSCLSLLVSAQKPLSPYDYGKLLNTDTCLVREAFKALHSVVQVPDEGVDGGSISIYHASFVDYVTSPTQRKQKWTMEKAVAHAATGDACFRIMNSMLCFGISGAQTSYLSNDEQPTPLKLESELTYACTTWGDHAIYAGLESETWKQKVVAFLRGEKVWYWLEALSAVKAVNYGYTVLWKISKAGLHIYEATSTELQTLSNDLGDLVHAYETPIAHSAPHLYLSAIPFFHALGAAPHISILSLESVPIVHHLPGTGREMVSINLETYTGCDCLVFSPDGKYIAAAINGNGPGTYSVIVYTRGGHRAPEIPAMMHPDHVRSIAYSPNGRCIASASEDGAVRIWDAQTGTPACEPLRDHTGTVYVVAYSPDGRYIASGSADNTVRLWDAQTGMPVLQPFMSSNTIGSVAYSPDGQDVVSGSADNTLRIWDLQTGRAAFGPITGHTGIVSSVAYSPDGKHIVSGSYDSTVRIWDACTGQATVGPMTGHTDNVRSVAFSPDGRFVVSCSNDKTVQIWDARTGKAASERLKGHVAAVISVAYSPDGKCIATGALDNTIRFWDAQMHRPASNSAAGHSATIWGIAYSPNGKFLASGSHDGTVQVWDAQTGDLSFPPIRMDNNMPVNSIAYSPDGEYLACSLDDGDVCLWHTQTGKPASDAMSGHTKVVWSVAFSPDGSTIVSGSGDKTARLWDARTGEPRGEPLSGHTDEVNAVAWSPDGKSLVSGADDKTVRVWDLTGAQRVFDPMAGHTAIVWSVAYSPDGRHIVSGSDDKTIRLWDAKTRQPIGKPITGHTEGVNTVVYSHDGNCIASGSDDCTIRLWDAQTGEPLSSPIIGHGSSVTSVAFSPTDGRIASGSVDSTLRIWKLPQENPTQMPRIPPTLHVPVYLHDYPHGVYTIGSDGWIRNSAGHLLLWVPYTHRTGLYSSASLERIIGNIATTKVELTKAVAHGENWLKCRDTPSRGEAHYGPWPV